MAETITRVAGNGPIMKIDDSLMKIYPRDPKSDFRLKSENSSTQTTARVNGTSDINEENKENRGSGEVRSRLMFFH